MSEFDAIAAIAANAPTSAPAAAAGGPRESAPATGFTQILSEAASTLEARIEHADAMVRRFVIDDSVPLHEVTIALEEARIAVDLALQVRTRVIETYRDIANMQL